MGFHSQDDYDNFISILDKKVNTNKMRLNDSMESANYIIGINFKTYVICNSCGEDWVLEIPDNPNRGYFLNKKGIEVYFKNKTEHDRKVRRNGLIILAIILIIIVSTFT